MTEREIQLILDKLDMIQKCVSEVSTILLASNEQPKQQNSPANGQEVLIDSPVKTKPKATCE